MNIEETVKQVNDLLDQAKATAQTDPQKALELLTNIDTRKLVNPEIKAKVYKRMMICNYHLGHIKTVRHLLEEYSETLASLEDPRLTLFFHKMTGILNVDAGNYTKGIEHIEKVIDLARTLGEPGMIFQETINIGVLFNNLKKPDKSLEYMLSAAELAEEYDFDKNDLLNNLAACYADLGKADKAIEYGLIHEKYLKDHSDQVMLPVCYINLGNAFTIKGDNTKALEYFSKAIELSEIHNLNDKYYMFRTFLANALISEHRFGEALNQLEKAYLEAEKQSRIRDKEKILRLQSECEAEMGNFKQAYNKLKGSEELFRKIIDESTRDKIAQYEAKLEVEHKLDEKEQMLLLYARQAEMGQMISAIAHQWRQPLNALSVILDSIYDAWKFEELDDNLMQEKISAASELIFSMDNTISDFRSFFRDELFIDKFEHQDVINKAIRFTEYRFKDNNIRLIADIKNNSKLSGSSNQLLQVILILLNNACDAFIDKTVEYPQVRIKLTKVNKYSVLQISDNAGGISPKIISRIFESNFSTKNKNENCGIGLYLAKMIIELKFKGSICANNENNGAVFTIKIPVDVDKTFLESK